MFPITRQPVSPPTQHPDGWVIFRCAALLFPFACFVMWMWG